MRPTGRCKRCHAPIRWAKSDTTGKVMPVDPHPADDGNIYVVAFEDGTPIVGVAKTPADVPASEPLRYTSHFATCPHAAEFRKKQ